MSRDDDFAAFMQRGGPAAVTRLERGQVVSGQVVQVDADSVFVALGTRSEGRIPALQLAARARPLQVGDTVEATVVDPDAPGGPLLALTLGAERGAGLEALALAYESGTPVQGKFTRALKSGLEVELGGVRAFCPASQLDLQHVADLATKVGETARFLVLELKDEGRSVIVSRRRVLEQERAVLARELRAGLRVGDEREGTVKTVQKYGAFVDLGGLEGLVHISELSATHVDRVGKHGAILKMSLNSVKYHINPTLTPLHYRAARGVGFIASSLIAGGFYLINGVGRFLSWLVVRPAMYAASQVVTLMGKRSFKFWS